MAMHGSPICSPELDAVDTVRSTCEVVFAHVSDLVGTIRAALDAEVALLLLNSYVTVSAVSTGLFSLLQDLERLETPLFSFAGPWSGRQSWRTLCVGTHLFANFQRARFEPAVPLAAPASGATQWAAAAAAAAAYQRGSSRIPSNIQALKGSAQRQAL